MRTLFHCIISVVAFSTFTGAADVERLRLIPFPKEIRPQDAQFRLGRSLVFAVSGTNRENWGRILNEELGRAGLPPARVVPLEAPSPAFRLVNNPGTALVLPTPPQTNAPEGYALEIRTDDVVCAARESAGLFYGLQTLCQLIRANREGDALPCLSVRDWSSLRWRCFQDDMTRGPSSTLDTLKFEAAMGSYLKLNLMTFYMEYQRRKRRTSFPGFTARANIGKLHAMKAHLAAIARLFFSVALLCFCIAGLANKAPAAASGELEQGFVPTAMPKDSRETTQRVDYADVAGYCRRAGREYLRQ